MKLYQNRKFAVVSFSDQKIRGVLFCRNRDGLSVQLTATEDVSKDDPSTAWKSVLRQMGRGKEYPLYLTGSLRDGVCFEIRQAELAPRFQRQAIEMELSRHLLSVPKHLHFQFVPLSVPEQGTNFFRVYAVPGNSFEPIAAMLTQGSSRADGYFYPAMALRQEDPLFFAEEMEPDHSFCGGWRGVPEQGNPVSEWKTAIEKEIPLLPVESSVFREFLLHFLVARLILQEGDYPGLQILPERIRSRRLRDQLKVTAVLGIVILLNLLWSCAGDWKGHFQEMRSLRREISSVQQENNALKRKLKSKEKMQKELSRFVDLSAGEEKLDGKLADLSTVIPSSLLTTSLRWSESGVDLQLQGADVQVDLAGAIRRLPYWKIGQLQQRRFGNSDSSTITLRLVPAEVKK